MTEPKTTRVLLNVRVHPASKGSIDELATAYKLNRSQVVRVMLALAPPAAVRAELAKLRNGRWANL